MDQQVELIVKKNKRIRGDIIVFDKKPVRFYCVSNCFDPTPIDFKFSLLNRQWITVQFKLLAKDLKEGKAFRVIPVNWDGCSDTIKWMQRSKCSRDVIQDSEARGVNLLHRIRRSIFRTGCKPMEVDNLFGLWTPKEIEKYIQRITDYISLILIHGSNHRLT